MTFYDEKSLEVFLKLPKIITNHKVVPNRVQFGGTVLSNSVLFGGTVPPNSVLFGGTVPSNSFLQL